jgi:signal peptide peptidase SppA
MKILDVLNSPWAIVPDKLREITEIYGRHLRGEKIDIDALRAQFGEKPATEERGYSIVDRVAVLPVEGVLAKRMNMFTRISGGASTQILGRDLARALDERDVLAVILSIDSPGGSVDGVQELARQVMAARSNDKPVVAWVDGFMASGAYWIGSATDAVFLGSDTDIVGSIGVAMQHVDYSGAETKAGIKTTDIYAGRYKRMASDVEPLSEAGREYLQAFVDAIYSVFVEDVARQRDVSTETVLNDMADGRIFIGRQAVNAGLVDGAATLDVLIADLAAGRYVRRRPQDGSTGAGVAPGAGAFASGAGAASISIISTKGTSMTSMNRAQLETEHPALVQSILDEGAATGRAEGVTAGRAEGLAEGRTEGARIERERIRAVEAQALPGHEALISALAFDGTTSGEQAAMQVLAAERALGKSTLAALNADAPKPAPHAPAPANTVAAPKIDTAEAFDAAVAAHVAAGQSRGRAIVQATHDLPDAHAAWITARNANRKAA